jgi:hypothetical protein
VLSGLEAPAASLAPATAGKSTRESVTRMLLVVAYTLLGLVAFATDQRIYVFVMRLLAFCVILYAIFEKNRRAP